MHRPPQQQRDFVKEFLSSCKLPPPSLDVYVATFIKEEISARELPLLTFEALRVMGFKAGHAIKVMKMVQSMNTTS